MKHGDVPGGGEAVDERFFWPPLERSRDGRRVVLIETVLAEDEDDEFEEPNRTSPGSCAELAGRSIPPRVAVAIIAGGRARWSGFSPSSKRPTTPAC